MDADTEDLKEREGRHPVTSTVEWECSINLKQIKGQPMQKSRKKTGRQRIINQLQESVDTNYIRIIISILVQTRSVNT